MNVSGGTDRYNFYVSGFYQSEDSPLKFGHDDSKRYSLRVKNEVKVLENLLFHSNISYTAHDHDFLQLSALLWHGGIDNHLGHRFILRLVNFILGKDMVIQHKNWKKEEIPLCQRYYYFQFCIGLEYFT